MAQKLHTTYGGTKIGAPTAEYPGGVPQNSTSPLAGDGMPTDEIQLRDLWGFLQAIMDQSGLTYSEVPDTALLSQYLQGLQLIYGALALDNKRGGQAVWDSITRMTTNPGVWKTANGLDLIRLDAALPKDVLDPWVEGPNVGGRAEDASSFLDSTFYRRFVARKPGVVISQSTVFFDDNATGANFFTGANAIAAGYTDPLLYKRAGWVRINGSGEVEHFLNDAEDTNRYQWHGGPEEDIDQAVGPNSGTREAFTLDHCPPNCLGDITWRADRSSNGLRYVVLTEGGQADSTPGESRYDIKIGQTGGGDAHTQFLRHFWRVDASQEMFARISGVDTDLDKWQALVHGWIDEAVAP